MTREEEAKELFEIFKSILDAKSQFDAYGIKSTEYNLKVNEKFFDGLEMAIKALEQEPCEDAISRSAAIDLIADFELSMGQVVRGIYALPPVNPQEQKTGYWILTIEDWNKWTCSECGFSERTDIHVTLGYNYCPKCGAKMESEKQP